MAQLVFMKCALPKFLIASVLGCLRDKLLVNNTAKTTLADLILGVRYLLKFSKGERTIRSQALFAQTKEAATYLKKTGSAHPLYGDGTLTAVVLRHGLGAMPLDMTQDVLDAFQIVLGDLSHQQE